MTTITHSEWLEKYKPINNHLAEDAPHDGQMFETYGDELDFVKRQPLNKVWTYLDGDEEESITNGYHFVNRIGYFVTEEPFVGDYLEVELYDNEDRINRAYNEMQVAWEDFDPTQIEGEGWAVFNLPETFPADPKQLLTVGIERNDEEGIFETDQEAYDFVTDEEGEQHALAIQIHDAADQLRRLIWGEAYVNSRVGPEPTTV